MILTGIRETYILTQSRKKITAYVAHHKCGWETGYIVGKPREPKDKSKSTAWLQANKRLTLHRRFCKIR